MTSESSDNATKALLVVEAKALARQVREAVGALKTYLKETADLAEKHGLSLASTPRAAGKRRYKTDAAARNYAALGALMTTAKSFSWLRRNRLAYLMKLVHAVEVRSALVEASVQTPTLRFLKPWDRTQSTPAALRRAVDELNAEWSKHWGPWAAAMAENGLSKSSDSTLERDVSHVVRFLVDAHALSTKAGSKYSMLFYLDGTHASPDVPQSIPHVLSNEDASSLHAALMTEVTKQLKSSKSSFAAIVKPALRLRIVVLPKITASCGGHGGDQAVVTMSPVPVDLAHVKRELFEAASNASRLTPHAKHLRKVEAIRMTVTLASMSLQEQHVHILA